MLRFLKSLISTILILIGMSLIFYPTLTTTTYHWKTEQYIEKYEKKHKQKNKEDDPLYWKIVAYNKQIYAEKQKDFKDAWSYTQAPFRLNLPEEKFGYIKIPSMDVTLPIYIGADNNNLAKGAAILGETSIPVGMSNTNSVIAGHRGYSGLPYFREIERVKLGDKVIIRNPWEKLHYVVTDIEIIVPDDIDKVKIQPGKDMITLVTCHPYRSHGKMRYLVYCQREGTETLGEDMRTTSHAFASSEPDIRHENMLRLAGLIFVVFFLSIKIFRLLHHPKKKKRSSLD